MLVSNKSKSAWLAFSAFLINYYLISNKVFIAVYAWLNFAAFLCFEVKMLLCPYNGWYITSFPQCNIFLLFFFLLWHFESLSLFWAFHVWKAKILSPLKLPCTIWIHFCLLRKLHRSPMQVVPIVFMTGAFFL